MARAITAREVFSGGGIQCITQQQPATNGIGS